MQVQLEDLLHATLDAYRSLLGATGESCGEAMPQIGHDLRQRLEGLRTQVAAEAAPGAIVETKRQAETELQRWSATACAYFKDKGAEVKELMLLVANTTQGVSERDQRYAGRLSELRGGLDSIAGLDDLTKIRQALSRSSTELKTCVERMKQDGEESVARLRAELSAYQSRLEETERQASQDLLTGVSSRRAVERQIELRISQARRFCLVFFDLNGFKQINDRHGHLAGDEVLKQFATQLQSFFRSTDVVGRWGGDEFIAVVDCGLEAARTRIERLREWVFGDYTIEVGGTAIQTRVRAAVGLAAWNPGETLAALLARADEAMYEDKPLHSRARQVAGLPL
ncbi:MAG: diguanylate cyclase [Acidobacteria bacterium]|nr:diguanylate cyclase [Acidobacteriota bacterium]